MKFAKTLTAIALAVVSTSAMAEIEFSFDRPGTGFGTGITPVGKLSWEQGLPTFNYTVTNDNGVKTKDLTLQSDVMLRTGLMKGLELQVGWDGPIWQKTNVDGVKTEIDGLGDMSVGLKKTFDLNDDKFAWAILAQANLATGNDEFTADADTYTLGSSVEYAYNDLVTPSISMFYGKQEGQGWTVTAVPTIGYNFTEKLSGSSEFVYSKTESEKAVKSLGTSLIYNPTERVQLDATAGLTLNDDSHRNYNGGLGVAFLF